MLTNCDFSDVVRFAQKDLLSIKILKYVFSTFSYRGFSYSTGKCGKIGS